MRSTRANAVYYGVLFVAACSARDRPALITESTRAVPIVAAPRITDASTPTDAPTDAPSDAPTASTDAPAGRPVSHPRVGSADDDATPPSGPGLLLDGGYGAQSVFAWMQSEASGGVAGRGDLVVIDAGGGDSASSLFALAPFHSAQTVFLLGTPTSTEYDTAAAIVAKAEVVFFTGGDQAVYARWKGSSLLAAVTAVYARGGVVGGSSAGMIILGAWVNDALITISENIVTPLCLANPYDSRMHFSSDLFTFPPLAGTVTDPHFSGRDRMGRLIAFLARQVKDTNATSFRYGIGVDDGAALVIDRNGKGTRFAGGPGPSAYIVRGGAPETCVANQPLHYSSLAVTKLAAAGDQYDFVRHCGNGLSYTLDVNGANTPYWSTDPYSSGTQADACAD